MFINLFCYVSEVNPNIVRLFACNSNFIMGLYSQAIVDSIILLGQKYGSHPNPDGWKRIDFFLE